MRGAENPVPEHGAKTESAVRFAIMVQQVASLDTLKPLPLEVEEV